MSWERPDFEKKMKFPDPPAGMWWELEKSGNYYYLKLMHNVEYKYLGFIKRMEPEIFNSDYASEYDFSVAWAINQAERMLREYNQANNKSVRADNEFKTAQVLLNGNDLR